MKRSPMTRGTVWKKARPIVRPGVTPKMPKGWRALATSIRLRDERCRRCGFPAENPHIDHIIPRKLLVGREVSTPSNLAYLCHDCHGWKTMVLEPKFYQGDILAFSRFLEVISSTGPLPTTALKGRAYRRLTEMLYGTQVASA